MKVWGACVIPFLEWNNCCFKLPDLFCVLHNVGCYIARVLIELGVLIAQGLLYVAEGLVGVYQIALKVVQVLVEVAKVVLEIAIFALEGVKVLFRIAIQALEAITRFLLTGIIDIRAMGFDAKIGVISHGHVRAWIDVSFFGSDPAHLEINLVPIFNPLALSSDLSDEAIPGVSRRKRASRRIDKVYWYVHFNLLYIQNVMLVSTSGSICIFALHQIL